MTAPMMPMANQAGAVARRRRAAIPLGGTNGSMGRPLMAGGPANDGPSVDSAPGGGFDTGSLINTRGMTSSTGGITGVPGTTPAGTLPRASQYGTAGTRLTTINPTDSLRDQAILPQASERVQRAGQVADRTSDRSTGFELSPWQSMSPYQSTAQARMDAIKAQTTAPVVGTDFTRARDALEGGLSRVSQQTQRADEALQGVGGVSFDDGGAGDNFTKATELAGGALVRNADTAKARGMTLERLSALQNPDRVKLATDAFSQLEEASRPEFEQMQRRSLQKSAAMGRRGSGLATSELGDLALQREKNLGFEKRRLATDAAGQQLADGLDVLGATSGVAGQFAGLDTADSAQRLDQANTIRGVGDSRVSRGSAAASAAAANANIGLQRASQLRANADSSSDLAWRRAGFERDAALTRRSDDVDNEERRLAVGRDGIRLGQDQADFQENADRFRYNSGVTERNAGRADEYDQYGVRRTQAGDAQGREGVLRGYEASDRDELRGERGYQDSLARRAQDDRIRMQEYAQWLETQNTGNATNLAGAGFGGGPSGMLMDASGQAQRTSQQAGAGAGQMASMLAELYARNRANGTQVVPV